MRTFCVRGVIIKLSIVMTGNGEVVDRCLWRCVNGNDNWQRLYSNGWRKRQRNGWSLERERDACCRLHYLYFKLSPCNLKRKKKQKQNIIFFFLKLGGHVIPQATFQVHPCLSDAINKKAMSKMKMMGLSLSSISFSVFHYHRPLDPLEPQL